MPTSDHQWVIWSEITKTQLLRGSNGQGWESKRVGWTRKKSESYIQARRWLPTRSYRNDYKEIKLQKGRLSLWDQGGYLWEENSRRISKSCWSQLYCWFCWPWPGDPDGARGILALDEEYPHHRISPQMWQRSWSTSIDFVTSETEFN